MVTKEESMEGFLRFLFCYYRVKERDRAREIEYEPLNWTAHFLTPRHRKQIERLKISFWTHLPPRLPSRSTTYALIHLPVRSTLFTL